MATKTTNETRVECSAEDANAFEFQQQELPEGLNFVLSIFICRCTATQTDVSGFSVNGHENSIGELSETVENLSRELKQLQCQIL